MASSILRLGLIVALLTTAACRSRDVPALPALPANQLHAVADFAVITDRGERSRALFLEASRVFLHPRCVNCHPNGDVPAQGMQMTPHEPPVMRGPEDHGVVGMECTSCHQDRNLELARVPGAPDWHLAPREMAWVGKTPRQICEQMKDPKRNGGRTLAQIVEHNAHDKLVGWGWAPGRGPRARARHAGAVRRDRRRVGRDRRRVPERGGTTDEDPIRVNGAERAARRRSGDAAALGAARRARPDRHEVRLRPGAVRRVHGAPRRPGGARVRDAGAARGEGQR